MLMRILPGPLLLAALPPLLLLALMTQAQTAPFVPVQVAKPMAQPTTQAGPIRSSVSGALQAGAAVQTTVKSSSTPSGSDLTGLVMVKGGSLPFSVGLPHDWQSLNLQDGMGGVSIANQKQAPFSMIRLLYLPKQSASVDLHAEFDHFEASLRAAGVTVQKQSETTLKCGGLSGVTRQYVLSSKAGRLMMKVWFAAGKRNFYSFQLTSPPSNYAVSSAIFDRVLASIDF